MLKSPRGESYPEWSVSMVPNLKGESHNYDVHILRYLGGGTNHLTSSQLF